jgi:hypothetical protein
MKIFYYIIAVLMCLLTTTAYAKEKVMTEAEIDWREYGRIEKGELTTEVQVKQNWDSTIVTLIFTNVSERELHLPPFLGLKVFLNDQKFDRIATPPMFNTKDKNNYAHIPLNGKHEWNFDLVKDYGIPANAVGKLTVQYLDTPPVTISLHTKHRTRLGEFKNLVKKKDE